MILSAYFSPEVGQWRPVGVFIVRDGRVIQLRVESSLRVPDYESVSAFATALANPPQTPGR